MGIHNRWSFLQHPTKPSLKTNEVLYWKAFLTKVLKIGIELEFNLPSPSGICEGDNWGCVCKYFQDNVDCWTCCALENVCSKNKIPNTCKNTRPECTEESCKTCKSYIFQCNSIYCSHFVSHCLVCNDYTTNCDTCKLRINNNKQPEKIRKTLCTTFRPSQSYGLIRGSAVHSIVTDGSLTGDGGAEIVTIGRRVDYWEFYNMLKNIIEITRNNKGFMDERSSIHMHILAAYYDKAVEHKRNSAIPDYINELEKDMPEIILINFHQLIRKYQNALTWLACGLNTKEHLTRWEKFRVSILNVSPLLTSMKEVRNTIQNLGYKPKYGFINYQFCQFNKSSNDVSRLHLEIRHLDGIESPSILAASACLFQALMIKAVEISRYGILEMESEDWLQKANIMKEALLNNNPDNWPKSGRVSFTEKAKKYYPDYINESIDLIQQVKHLLIPMGPAYEVLEKLVEKPAAFLRIEGKSWDEVEKYFEVKSQPNESKIEKFINEIIDIRLITNCETIETWIINATELCKKELTTKDDNIKDIKEEITTFVANKQQEGEIIWSQSLGSIVLL